MTLITPATLNTPNNTRTFLITPENKHRNSLYLVLLKASQKNPMYHAYNYSNAAFLKGKVKLQRFASIELLSS